MGWPSLLVLVRHAESEGNIRSAEERAAFEKSTKDYALTERGREQARFAGEYLKKKYPESFHVFYTSYYARARQTMELMMPGERVYEDPRLREAERGMWHIMTRDEVAVRYPYEIERKERDGLYHYRPLGGENWPDVELRIHSFLGTVARDQEGQNVLIVVHGHWLILFQRLIHHFSIEEAVQRYQNATVENASVTVYRNHNPRSFINNGRHLTLCEDECIVPWQGKL